MKRGNAESRQR